LSTLLPASQLLKFLRKLLQRLRELLFKTLWTALTSSSTCAARLTLVLASAHHAGNCLLQSTQTLREFASGLLQSASGLLQTARSLFKSTHLSHA
jgi:hypothetical protein